MSKYNVTVKRNQTIDYEVDAACVDEAIMIALGCANAEIETVSVKKRAEEYTLWQEWHTDKNLVPINTDQPGKALPVYRTEAFERCYE